MTTLRSRPNSQARDPVAFLHRLWQIHAPLTLLGMPDDRAHAVFHRRDFRRPARRHGCARLAQTDQVRCVDYALHVYHHLAARLRKCTERVWKRRLVNIAGWVLVGTFIAEMVPITLASFKRGTTSHFNVSTPLDAALWSLMAVSIVILWTTNFVIAALLLFQRFENPAFAWSLRLGLIITIIGMGLGFLMTTPTAQQLASWQGGTPVTLVGAHTVGLTDGGPGLPLVGWSTRGGDLRIGHFVGMHALQVLPFLGLLVTAPPQVERAPEIATRRHSGGGLFGRGAAGDVASPSRSAARPTGRADPGRVYSAGW